MTPVTTAKEAIEAAAKVADTLHYPDETKISASIRDAIRAIPVADPVGVTVKPLEWGEPDRNGGYYCSFDIGAGFAAYYTIEQNDYDLAEVRFGIHCHEFGDEVVWKGPKEKAIEAANEHNERRVLSCLTVADDPRVAALVEAAGPLDEAAEAMLRMMDDVIKGSGQGDMAIKPDHSLTVVEAWKRLSAFRTALAAFAPADQNSN